MHTESSRDVQCCTQVCAAMYRTHTRCCIHLCAASLIRCTRSQKTQSANNRQKAATTFANRTAVNSLPRLLYCQGFGNIGRHKSSNHPYAEKTIINLSSAKKQSQSFEGMKRCQFLGAKIYTQHIVTIGVKVVIWEWILHRKRITADTCSISNFNALFTN